MTWRIRFVRTTCLCAFLLIAVAGTPAQGQRFWSPRHVALDTYTEPVPFLCDGEVLLAYELHITNMDRLPILLAGIDVFGDGSPAPADTYSGESLAESLTRIRVVGQLDDVCHLRGGQRAILHVLLRHTERSELPEELTHEIRYAFLKDDGSEVAATVRGGAIRVAAEREALVIGAPLGEGIWLAGRGVSRGLPGHRGGAIRPQNGIPYQKGRYAVDFVGFDATGHAFTSPRTRNESWFGYGAEVLAVADARVVTVRDGLPDSPPFYPERLESLTGETLGGNSVVLDLGEDLFAFYGHLQPGSIVVREGEQVRQGQLLGRLGSSGNSDAPHLHFQINRAIPRLGEAVPYVFEGYEYLGVSEPGWHFDRAQLLEGTVMGRVEDRLLGSRGKGDGLAPTAAIADSVKASLLRNMMGASAGGTPAWTQALRTGGDPREQEMPGADVMVRFEASVREGVSASSPRR